MIRQIFNSKNSIRYEFFETNYLKCSNNFAANCTIGKKVYFYENNSFVYLANNITDVPSNYL